MFVLLEKWLTSKLGNNVGSDLNLSNVGEKFKDGVLFARLLHKYQVIPDRYVRVLKRTNFYAACFINIKNLNVWLKPLDITVDDCVVRDIACGQSLAVTRLLFQLYFKFETEKEYRIDADDFGISENERFDGVDVANDLCRNVLSDRGKREEDAFDSNNDETFDIYKIWCDSDAAGVRYSAVDFLKSENRHKSALDFTQHNLESFYDLFVNSLTDSKRLFRKEFVDEESDKTCKRILDGILGADGGGSFRILTVVPNNDNDSKLASNLNSETNDSHMIIAELDNEHRISSDINGVPTDRQHSKTEILTSNNLKTAESFTLDEHEQNERFQRQDQLFTEYLEHVGPWSSERLNVTNVHGERKENIRVLSTVVKEVLNFEYGKSEIKPIALKKTQIAGVIDKIQNKKVVHLITDSLRNRGILSFTADDALSACLNAFEEKLNNSANKNKLRRGSDGSVAEKQTQQDDNSDAFKSEFDEMAENDLCMSFMAENASAINESGDTFELTYTNKYTQTYYEDVSEPKPDDLNGSDVELSPMACLGKLIDEKHRKNHDLQIGDVINCVGEFLKENVGNNYDGSGWVLLEFPCQPLQMTLLEYKLTGKIPPFGRELCKTDTRTSRIVPDYEEDVDFGENESVDAKFLSHCVKIVRHRDEIKNEIWNEFFDFYKDRNSVSVVSSSNVRKHAKRAADVLVGMVLNEENEHKSKKVFRPKNVYGDDRGGHLDDSADSEIDNNRQLGSEPSSMTIAGDKNRAATNAMNQQVMTLKQFKLVNAGWSLRKVVPTDYVYKAFYLRDTWDTMENGYVRQVKELLDSKDAFFRSVKARDDLIVNTTERVKRLNNPRFAHTINDCGDDFVFGLQCDLWDNVDAEWEQTTRFINRTIDEPRTTIEDNGVLIGIYKRLLETELKRAVATLNVLNGYYDCNVDEFKFDGVQEDLCAETVDAFRKFCSDATSTFENYVRACSNCYGTTTDGQVAWTRVLAEKNRFADQASRIEASARSDKKRLDGLTRVGDRLETVRAVHRFKTNDINNLCKLLERAKRRGAAGDRGIRVEQMSGRFYVNGTSVFETVCDRTFRPRDNFDTRRLRTLADKLLADCPAYETTVDRLVDALNGLCETVRGGGVYPENWPKNDRFRDGFARAVLGSHALTTVDWRDFVVQCMELPCPDMEQLLSCRKLFVANDVRGDETVTDDVFDATELWFENGSIEEAKKRLLSDMYRTKDGVNYSAMLLAFCRDQRPWMGVRKSFGLIFGRDPTGWKTAFTTINPSDNDVTQLRRWYCGSGGEPEDGGQLVFDEYVMTWFLMTCLKSYSDGNGSVGKPPGNRNVSRIVKSVFAHVQTTRTEQATIVDLFRNNVMDELYDTVYKFQTRKLSEIAKKLVTEYDVCVEL